MREEGAPPAELAVPVTTPTQTLIDLSSVLPRPALERALEAAETLRLLDVSSLPPKLGELARTIDPRHHGTRAAFERDRERDSLLTAGGWRVVRLTHRRLGQRREVGDLLERPLSARSPSRATPG